MYFFWNQLVKYLSNIMMMMIYIDILKKVILDNAIYFLNNVQLYNANTYVEALFCPQYKVNSDRTWNINISIEFSFCTGLQGNERS